MTLELQKPVDRRFKSDHPHTLILVALVLFLLVFPVLPLARAVHPNSSPLVPSSSGASSTTSTTTGFNSCLNRGGPPFVVPSSTRVAIVMPIFTATPYSQYIYGSFYAFFKKYQRATPGANITSDLNLLNTSVSSGMHWNFGWGHSYPLYIFLKSKAAENCGLVFGKNLMVISDINITQGALFKSNGSANFDVLVYGFQEYVSAPEYQQLVKFVAGGGRLVIMGGDAFQVRVYYNPKNHFETYVLGHGFAYNNRTAWRTVPVILGFDLTRFTAGIDCCFRSGTYSGAKVNVSNPIGAGLASVFGNVVMKSYAPHEEDSVRNLSHTSIIAVFRNTPGMLVASYVHQYRKGFVICLCIFGDDIISGDQSAQYFAMLAIGTPASSFFSGGGTTVTPAYYSPIVTIADIGGAVAAVAAIMLLASHRRVPRE